MFWSLHCTASESAKFIQVSYDRRGLNNFAEIAGSISSLSNNTCIKQVMESETERNQS